MNVIKTILTLVCLILTLNIVYSASNFNACNVNFQQPFFEVKDKDKNSIFLVDNNGNFFLRGTDFSSNTKDSIESFVVSDQLYFNSQSSIFNNFNQRQSSIPTGSNGVIINDNSGNIVSYLSKSGNINTKGFGVYQDNQANCQADGWYCSGLTRENRDYYCDIDGENSASCQYDVLSSQTCTAPSPTTSSWTCNSDNTSSQRTKTTHTPYCSSSGCGYSTSTNLETQSCSSSQTCVDGTGCVAASCTGPDGSIIPHGDSKLYYQSSNEEPGMFKSTCTNSQARTCNAGVLSGSYTVPNCDVGCQYQGTQISGDKNYHKPSPVFTLGGPDHFYANSGETRNLASSQKVSYDDSCDFKSRTCNSGSWNPSDGFHYSTCTQSNYKIEKDNIVCNHGFRWEFTCGGYVTATHTYDEVCKDKSGNTVADSNCYGIDGKNSLSKGRIGCGCPTGTPAPTPTPFDPPENVGKTSKSFYTSTNIGGMVGNIKHGCYDVEIDCTGSNCDINWDAIGGGTQTTDTKNYGSTLIEKGDEITSPEHRFTSTYYPIPGKYRTIDNGYTCHVKWDSNDNKIKYYGKRYIYSDETNLGEYGLPGGPDSPGTFYTYKKDSPACEVVNGNWACEYNKNKYIGWETLS